MLFTQSGADQAVWSVSEITTYIRELFEIDYRLQDVMVEGEISNFTRARSGHLYFTLKDERAQLLCVMWRSAAMRLRFDPGDGDAVQVTGRISVYEASGRYQLYAESMRPAGRGNLALAFEQLREQLELEGLFAPEHKKAIPVLPRKIGIVTSADAAALRDILNVLRRRCQLVEVLLAPTLVQGPEAPAQIVRALQWLDGRDDIDTIIIARGGGSLEDLMAFNDEQVARAIFAARHPIIVGVGHETDVTIADYVADLRAPTPSAAAELAVPDMQELQTVFAGMQNRLEQLIHAHLQRRRQLLQSYVRLLDRLGPQMRLANERQWVDGLISRLETAMARRLERAQSKLAVAQARLQAVSPLATLARGYAIVRRDGQVIRQAAQVRPGDRLQVQLADGSLSVVAEPAPSEQETAHE